jgi:serine/threonine-protein kinase HipA
VSFSKDSVFEGLFGIFNDGLADGWKRLLFDRKGILQNINTKLLSPLDRLCYIATHAMGVLRYESAIDNSV